MMIGNRTQAAIRNFTTELHDAIRADLIDSFSGRGAANSPRAKVLSKTAPRTKGAKRSPDELELLVKKLNAYVVKNPGKRIEQIALGMNITTRELNLPVKKLVGARKFATKGQKRATTYFPGPR